MSDYSMKKALVDLGFIDGYVHATEFDFGDLDESLWMALHRLENRFITGKIEPHLEDTHARAHCLHDLGFIRGMLWTTPIPHAIAEALDRIIGYALGDDDFCSILTQWDDMAEPIAEQLSHEQRNATLQTGGNGDDACSADVARSLGAPHAGVLNVSRKLGVMNKDEIKKKLAKGPAPKDQPESCPNPVDGSDPLNRPEPDAPSLQPIGSMDLRPSARTPERRAAQAERTKNRPRLVPESSLEAVKADWESGMPFDQIGSKHRCSASHIRNFLKKHGIDPRRGRLGTVKPIDPEPAGDAGRPAQDAEPSSNPSAVSVKPDVFEMLTGNLPSGEIDQGEAPAPLH
jgi:hypothetical protein